jgi:hypothetical protein
MENWIRERLKVKALGGQAGWREDREFVQWVDGQDGEFMQRVGSLRCDCGSVMETGDTRAKLT